jgi:hypothetical protein
MDSGGTLPPRAPVLAPERGLQRKGWVHRVRWVRAGCARLAERVARPWGAGGGAGVLALGESLCAPALARGTQRNGWVRLVRWVRGVCSAGGEGRARPGRPGSAGEAGVQGPVCGSSPRARQKENSSSADCRPLRCQRSACASCSALPHYVLGCRRRCVPGAPFAAASNVDCVPPLIGLPCVALNGIGRCTRLRRSSSVASVAGVAAVTA